ncbi:TldD/PmbA family protein [Sulfitobacter aestuariivivens]|uniref:TldD/PmbA family protein n=1 Tax=Sulfitobacter aestuariivivens TaxID=2766981 RepID=A0A927D8Q7_9RHOB|nr:TldD/PmbA family protein [Sulfitobacter aestuariivivens]MBD3665657.1 TldD/PmbA family protein [Sulfitobacter aestuariivivens]
MTQPLSELTQSLLHAARKAGADSADALAVEETALTADVRGGALEQAERAEGIDIGLRAFVGRRFANVSASDTSSRTIEEMAARAVAMAREAPEDPYAGLADADQIARNWDVNALQMHDPSEEPSPATLQKDATQAEAAALAVKGVTQVQSASASYGSQQIWMAASNGFEGGYRRTNSGHSCVAIAGEGLGMERDYDGDSRIFRSDLRGPADIGTSAGHRALARLNPRKPPTGSFPVLFDERISASLIGHLLSAINGAAIARGASWLRDAMGEMVLPAGLDLEEDPHRVRTTGSLPFDGEGLPTARRALVKDGVLKGWTLDLANARKLGLSSTANAARGTSAAPTPTNWNVSLTQGSASRDDLIRDMGTGLLVTSMIGSTINPNTGDYSRGAAGLWVENGEVTHAINECTIAGNLREMLASIVPANDARVHLSRVVPSLLVPGMTLAGA